MLFIFVISVIVIKFVTDIHYTLKHEQLLHIAINTHLFKGITEEQAEDLSSLYLRYYFVSRGKLD